MTGLRVVVVALAVALALAPVARADDGEPTSRPTTPPPAGDDARAIVTAAFADQRAAVERSAAAVGDKLAVAVATRAARARAAYKLLRVQSAGRELEPALAISRRRAAVRYLLARDRSELELLADEASRLLAARQRIDRDAERAATIALPTELAWPVRGTIARGFGPFQHEKSRTTLTRRGLDLEVAAAAEVVAPGAGTVRYAGPIRGLDQGVILDHGDYLTVIAKLATPTVHAGDTLAAGAALGHAARHRVYFELRLEVGPGGIPIDPLLVLPKP